MKSSPHGAPRKRLRRQRFAATGRHTGWDVLATHLPLVGSLDPRLRAWHLLDVLEINEGKLDAFASPEVTA